MMTFNILCLTLKKNATKNLLTFFPRFQHRWEQGWTFQYPWFRGGLICRDSFRVHHISHYHHHSGGSTVEVSKETQEAFTAAHGNSVA